MTDIYKFAAMHGLRFPSTKGDLTVEQLFEMPLTSRSGFDLDTTAQAINRELKACGEESFVATTPNPRVRPLEVGLEILKDVIATKQKAAADAAARVHRAEERRKILEALSAKKDQALTASSIEDLEQKLAALDAE